MNRGAFLAGLAGLAGVVASIIAAHAQSFDCRYARNLDEKTICRDQVLGRLDEQLGSVYRQLLLQVPKPDREKLDKEEEKFVIARRQCGSRHSCIQHSYQRRIDDLQKALARAKGDPGPLR